MEEIKIEKKKPVWPWIIGLLLIAGIIGYFVFFNNDEQVEVDRVLNSDNVENHSIGSDSEIVDYVNYINDVKMGLDHEYSSGAIVRLIDATRATAEALNVDTDADLSQANNFAEEITQDPQSLNHADKIKRAGQIINSALNKIQKEKFPQFETEYNNVAMAAEKIDPARPTLQQKDAVKTYFNSAATLLNNIKNDYGKER